MPIITGGIYFFKEMTNDELLELANDAAAHPDDIDRARKAVETALLAVYQILLNDENRKTFDDISAGYDTFDYSHCMFYLGYLTAIIWEQNLQSARPVVNE